MILEERYQHAISKLQEDGILLPYDLFPGSLPGGRDYSIFTNETEWNAYQWNPPEFLAHLDEYGAVDLDASPKPTFQQLEIAGNSESLVVKKREITRLIKRVCRRKITEAYGQNDHHDEIELRLGGRHTEAQDTERERLRTRYSIIKAWIESTDRTLAELESLDLTDNATWTGETWPPVRGGL